MPGPRLHMRTPFNSAINVTPLIDVLLVLLIIFMLVQILGPKYLNINVPDVVEAAGPATPEIVLELTADGGYSLNGAPVTTDVLASRLAGVYAGRPRSVLFIKTAPNRRYWEFIEAADVARGAGVSVVSLAPSR